METVKILIIEDDPEIQEMLKYAFAKEGWKLIQVKTGEEGMASLRSAKVDCIILDIMLPGMDGFRTLKKIREDENFRTLPIIMCTARGEETDIVTGLELGADDYVVKPYSPRVLAARIRTAIRRKENLSSPDKTSDKTFWQYEDLKLDTQRHSCFLGDELLDLSTTEFAMLLQFMSHPDIVFSRQKLINAIRGPDYPVTDRSVDVHILGLRKKLKDNGSMIETIRGVGYRFKTAGV